MIKYEPTGLSWSWIGFQALVPFAVALVLAYPFWRRRHAIFGNLFGTTILFGAAFALIMRERIELDRIATRCFDQGFYCFPVPTAFARFATYSGIALLQVFILFYVSIRVEERQRSRGYAPEWRR